MTELKADDPYFCSDLVLTLGSTSNAKVVKTDIVCSNGVIHVIDAVVLPQ